MPFSRIYGHEGPIAFLKKSLEENRVAQGYLFHGMWGVGKRTTALAFAKAMNCLGTEGEEGGPCGSCRKIDSGNHPDVLIVTPQESLIKVDVVRELTRRMSFRPLEGRRRIIIIDEAHSMNAEAANALLKTLEEPSPDNVMILVTHRHDALPATILSRCRKVRFGPVPAASVKQFLRDRGGMSEDEILESVACSGGSIGRVFARDPKKIRRFKEEVLPVLGKGIWDSREDPLVFFAAVKGFGEGRDEVRESLDLLEEWLRDVMVYRETGHGEMLIHRDLQDLTRESAAGLSRRDILERLERVGEARKAVDRNVNRRLVLESMILNFLAPPSAHSAGGMKMGGGG